MIMNFYKTIISPLKPHTRPVSSHHYIDDPHTNNHTPTYSKKEDTMYDL